MGGGGGGVHFKMSAKEKKKNKHAAVIDGVRSLSAFLRPTLSFQMPFPRDWQVFRSCRPSYPRSLFSFSRVTNGKGNDKIPKRIAFEAGQRKHASGLPHRRADVKGRLGTLPSASFPLRCGAERRRRTLRVIIKPAHVKSSERRSAL